MCYCCTTTGDQTHRVCSGTALKNDSKLQLGSRLFFTGPAADPVAFTSFPLTCIFFHPPCSPSNSPNFSTFLAPRAGKKEESFLMRRIPFFCVCPQIDDLSIGRGFFLSGTASFARLLSLYVLCAALTRKPESRKMESGSYYVMPLLHHHLRLTFG